MSILIGSVLRLQRRNPQKEMYARAYAIDQQVDRLMGQVSKLTQQRELAYPSYFGQGNPALVKQLTDQIAALERQIQNLNSQANAIRNQAAALPEVEFGLDILMFDLFPFSFAEDTSWGIRKEFGEVRLSDLLIILGSVAMAGPTAKQFLPGG